MKCDGKLPMVTLSSVDLEMHNHAAWVESAWLAVLSAMVAFFAVSIFGSGFTRDNDGVILLWLGMVPIHLVGYGTALVLLRKRLPPTGLSAEIGIPQETMVWVDIVRSALITVLWLYPAVALLTCFTSLIMTQLDMTLAGSPITALSKLTANPVLFWSSATITALIIAPITEEFLFRLICFNAMRPAGRAGAAMATAALFAVVHRIPEQIPGLFLLGIVLQHCRERHQSLVSPITLHIAFNATGLLILLVLVLTGHSPAGM